MDSREVIKLLLADGWIEVAHAGSHKQFRHPVKKGRVTVPHPRKDLHPKTLKSVWRQAGLLDRRPGDENSSGGA